MSEALAAPTFVLEAQRAVGLAEVQEMIRKLSAFGLAVSIPHMHTHSEDFAPLPNDVVQLEKDLQVSFPRQDTIGVSTAIPVAWRWVDDQTTGHVAIAGVCVPMVDGSHKTLPGT